MRAENLQEVIRAAPFRPFTLFLADGTRVPVRHPEWIAYAGGRTAIVIEQDERSHIIDVMLVTKLEVDPLAPTVTTPGNSGAGE
jgi:hypothetical protein